MKVCSGKKVLIVKLPQNDPVNPSPQKISGGQQDQGQGAVQRLGGQLDQGHGVVLHV